MPTIASSNVPTPKSWDEFEDITLAAAKLRWNSSDFFRNGRPGQKQDGVDIWCHDDDKLHQATTALLGVLRRSGNSGGLHL
jgi:hypothetical protein